MSRGGRNYYFPFTYNTVTKRRKNMNKETYYITTPIYYPSSNLHIGHAYTTVAADTAARYKRMRGYDVLFLTGTDEHGQKIGRKAKDAGQEPIVFVDEQVAKIKYLWDRLYVKYDDFIRTTEPRHEKVVQEIFQKIYDKGDIYKDYYEGWYCVQCEAFWTERQLAEGKACPDCNRPTELVREESYFFKMSKYADRLLQHIEDNPEFIQPVSRRNEMISFIKSGLEDLCVSRTSFDWGIPLPFDPKHVVYVWFDALTNYISALGYGSDPEKFQRYWPADVHLMAKEIVRFHSIIWPIILMAAEIELPKQVFGHGWLVLESGKMSKSKGNVVDPLVLIDKYGVDAVRYYLLREIPFGLDGTYSEQALINRLNSDLANDFGNLLSRTVAMLERYFDSVIPAPAATDTIDDELIDLTAETVKEAAELLDRLEFSNALAAIWKLIGRANKYIDETTPWILAREEAKKPRLGTVLYNLAEVLRTVTVLITPYMPLVPLRVWRQLGLTKQPAVQTWESIQAWGGIPAGTQVEKGAPVFPRIDLTKEAQSPEPSPATPKEARDDGIITIDDFKKMDLRVAKVLAVEKVAKADKLLRLTIAIGKEERQIVSGIAQFYEPEELVGKTIIVVANLKPAKIFGLESKGMLLAASDREDSKLALATLDREMESGYRLS
ncbi:MAG: methionine--tRNA ligase [bacterium]